MKKISLFIVLPLLVTTLINSPSLFATTRGITVTAKTGQSLYLYRNYHALVVGVSNYEKWPRLPNAANDAKEVAAKLKKMGFEVKLVLDPTSREMKTVLNEMVYKMGTEENRALLFYYAGHGETETLADKTKLGYIIPRDCPILEKDPLGFATHAISMRDIESVSLRIKAKHVLMLFDSCFSGSLFSLVRAVPHDITEKSALPVRQYITAGREDEQVPDKSMFKRCLLIGLEGDADLTGDGYITGSELGMYLSDKVVNYTHRRQHPQYGKINNPDLDRGDFIFALKGAPKEKEFAPVKPPEPPEPGDLEDYEAIIKERTAKKKWAQWQVRMEEDFAKAEGYDRSQELTSKEKVEAWADFLSSYGADNPYSAKDDKLRKNAENRRRYWKGLKVTTGMKSLTVSGKSNEQREAFRSAKTVQIVVNQSYRNVREVSLPFEDVARTLVKCAGLRVVGLKAEDYDLELRIIANGHVTGQYYKTSFGSFGSNSHELYTGAFISGEILLGMQDVPFYKETFECFEKGPSDISSTLINKYKKTSGAPLLNAFRTSKSNSFVPKIMELIGKVYSIDCVIAALRGKDYWVQNSAVEALWKIGKPAVEPLIAALKDVDPSARRLTERALKKITGQNFAEDPVKWQQWWEENKDKFPKSR